MFKPGDTALVTASGKLVTVKALLLPSTGIETEDNTGLREDYQESELQQGHPTVLATANPKYVTAEEQREQFLEEYRKNHPVSDRPKVEINREFHREVIDLLKESTFDVDLKGHWRNGASFYDFERFKKQIPSQMFLWALPSDEDARDLKEALTSKTALGRWINLGPSSSAFGHDGCSYCGVKRFNIETNGLVLRLSCDPCPLPNGFEPNTWELNVPSGKILVANDLREWFPLPEGDGDIESVNGVRGCRQTAQAYAAAGMSHAFVGNTCPGVFKLSDSSFKIASEPSDEEWNGEEWVEKENSPAFEGERVAGVCTDLWWYSLCDADEFDRRLKKFGGSFEDAGIETVAVKPGVYRFQHFDDADRDSDEGTLYATFEWVRDPDPVKDFLKTWDEVDVNPHAYVQAQVKRWPTLYGVRTDRLDFDGESALPWSAMSEEQRLSSWKRVMDQAFCTIGSGTEWHEKGFPRSKVDPTVPDIEPPSFRQQNHWYPFSKPYGGLYEPKFLSPSFAKVAFRILESVISFGKSVRDDNHCRDVPYVRQRMQAAVERYRELMEQYPEQADPDYVVWLNQKGRAEAWVERFDLGPTFTEKHRKHAESQRWVPDDAYAIEFDARKLKNGHFAWAKGYWAKKEDAERYAIVEWSDNGQEDPRQNCFWASHAKNTAIPLYSVARVVKLGQVSHMGDTIIEVAFDYGTAWMTDPAKRKAVSENGERAAIRVLTKEEYKKLLPKAKAFFSKRPTVKKNTTKKKPSSKKTNKKSSVKKAAKKAKRK